jgi:hypothetical protein
MSQHQIDPRNPKHIAIVGYDRPHNNFFGIVHNEDGPMHWVSGEATPQALAEEMEPFAVVTPKIIDLLLAEQSAGGSNAAYDHRTFDPISLNAET